MNAADVKKAANPRKPCLNFPETLAMVSEIAATAAESQVSVAEISAIAAESQASVAEIASTAAESQVSVAGISATTAESQASVAEIASTAAESQVSVAEISATRVMVAEKKIRRFRGPGKNKKVPVVKEKKAKKEELLARAFFLSSTLPLDSPLRYRYWNNAEKSSKHTVRELKNFFQRYEAM